jgi:hypothetical protein
MQDSCRPVCFVHVGASYTKITGDPKDPGRDFWVTQVEALFDWAEAS